ncbi:hypothetical protein HPB47_016821, partial [Ixodes persulcatus]
RLGEQAILKRCINGMTQDAIGSIHSVIRGQNFKNMHDSRLSLERAVAEAVSLSWSFSRHSNEKREQTTGQVCVNGGSVPKDSGQAVTKTRVAAATFVGVPRPREAQHCYLPSGSWAPTYQSSTPRPL